MTARARFSQADLKRAIQAFEKAGMSVSRVRFTSDGFEFFVGQPEDHESAAWFKDSPLYRSKAA